MKFWENQSLNQRLANLDQTLGSRIIVQVGKIAKINKSAAWNKAMQVGILGILLLHTGVAISTGTEFQMTVAQKWLKPGSWDFLHLFFIKFSAFLENLTVVAFMGVDS